MSLDWERSAKEVYVQRHGSVPFWVDLLDDDGRVVGAPGKKTLRETKGGQGVLAALNSAYDRVFVALRIVTQPRIVERFDEFEFRIRTATDSVRGKSSASTRQKFASLFNEEEGRALSALRSIAQEPAAVSARKTTPPKKVPSTKKKSKSPRKVHGIGPVKTGPQKKLGVITVKASVTDGEVKVSWTAPMQPIPQLAGWLVVLKAGDKILRSLTVGKNRREATHPLGRNVPDTVIVYAQRGSGHAARGTTSIVSREGSGGSD